MTNMWNNDQNSMYIRKPYNLNIFLYKLTVLPYENRRL